MSARLQPNECVLLMAGTGSRLAATTGVMPKALIQIGGKALIEYALDSLGKIGVRKLHIVIGPKGAQLPEALRGMLPAEMSLNTILNRESHKQNGLSVLAAAGQVQAPFLLAMGDHIFERALLDALLEQSDPECLNLALDRKISTIFDLEDAMKVQTRGDRVEQIGKALEHYNAIDTGLFLCPAAIFDYLRRALKDGDCSLADGVRAMALEGKVKAIEIGEAWWQDVDTPEMLRQAEARLS